MVVLVVAVSFERGYPYDDTDPMTASAAGSDSARIESFISTQHVRIMP